MQGKNNTFFVGGVAFEWSNQSLIFLHHFVEKTIFQLNKAQSQTIVPMICIDLLSKKHANYWREIKASKAPYLKVNPLKSFYMLSGSM